jgi:N utilization substance protein B
MISRRNIRVKVMQTLYALDTNLANETANPENFNIENRDYSRIVTKYLRVLDDKIEHASFLFTLSFYYITKIAQYTEIDANNRAGKYLPTQADLNVNTKLAGNEVVWALLENETFKECCKNYKFESIVETDDIKQLYQQLLETNFYQSYIQEDSRTTVEEKQTIWNIWTELMYESDWFNALMNDKHEEWEDDKDLVNILIENFTKKRINANFLNFISNEKKEYAHELLKTVMDKNEYLMSLIQPRLQNWDAERVAHIDLLLLKMGLAEFLYFPTIPTKVTINEYIEIAKTYSTPQSGQFINGVLDNILKLLTQENKIKKIARP